MAENLPGGGLWGWLGRQFGYVKKAVETDVGKKVEPKAAEPGPTVIYRKDHVREAVVPEQPGVKLRRTVIDEVIVEEDKK